MTEMRILTVRQPWAWAIIHGGKNVENRVRNIAGSFRGPIAIHVALDDAEAAPGSLWRQHADWYRNRAPQPKTRVPAWSDRGRIIGAVDLVSVHDGRTESLHTNVGEIIGTAACSSWAQSDAHHLVLANPRALADPIPYRGALGLRRLDEDMTARVMEAVA